MTGKFFSPRPSHARSASGRAWAASLFAANALISGILVSGILVSGAAAADDLTALKGHDVNAPVNVSADRLEIHEKENLAVFRGRVTAEQGSLKLAASRVTVHYAAAGGTDRTVTRINCDMKVTLTSPSETVTSDWAVYDLKDRLITLGGGVDMRKNGNALHGNRVVLDLASGVTRIDGANTGQGRVTGTFEPPKRN